LVHRLCLIRAISTASISSSGRFFRRRTAPGGQGSCCKNRESKARTDTKHISRGIGVAKRRPKVARGERSEAPGTVSAPNRVLKGRGTHLHSCTLWCSSAPSGRELFISVPGAALRLPLAIFGRRFATHTRARRRGYLVYCVVPSFSAFKAC